MAQTVQQMYDMVNDVSQMALGSIAIKVVDPSSFVSLGQQVLASPENTDAFFGVLNDVLSRTIVAIRVYEGFDRSVKRDESQWGAIIRKVSYKMGKMVKNWSWDMSKQASIYDVVKNAEISQKLFRAIGTFSYEDLVPAIQPRTAFRDPMEMMAVISGIYIAKDNAMKLALERLGAMTVNTYMAGVINSTSTVCKRNLLAEYNALTGVTPITVAEAMYSAPFLKFASREINMVCENMKSFSTIYNVMGNERFTPRDKMVVEVNSQFASAVNTYLESDTFHKELVSLPRYETVPYWQASGKFDFATVTSIAVQLDEDTAVTQSGIIACVHDYDAVATSMYDRRNYSEFNKRSEVIVVMDKAEVGSIADLGENGVVFYIEDTTAPTSVQLDAVSVDDVIDGLMDLDKGDGSKAVPTEKRSKKNV